MFRGVGRHACPSSALRFQSFSSDSAGWTGFPLEQAPLTIRLARRRKPSALGYLSRHPAPLPEDQRGVAISTLGKVIKRGWDWLCVTSLQAERINGLIEVPDLAASLTLNKGDFIRTGSRGTAYLAYRIAIQEAVSRQLETWGDGRAGTPEASSRMMRPLERDLDRVLEELSDDFVKTRYFSIALRDTF
jgi:hypothetical protein